MTKNLDNEGLRVIADNYDLFYIDLWGVIHNGIKLHEEAIIALKELLKMNKDFVLLTNAPRPNLTVKKFLEKMGMDEKIRNHVFTSGEAALNYLKKFYLSENFFHARTHKLESLLSNQSTLEEKSHPLPILFNSIVSKKSSS